MTDIKKAWKEFDLRAGNKTYEVKIPVSRLIEALEDNPQSKPVTHHWVYECGCPAPEMYRSKPYCPVHGMKLVRKEL